MCWFAQAAIEPVACSLTSQFGSFCLYHCSLQYKNGSDHTAQNMSISCFVDLFFYSFLSKSRANSSPISPLCRKNIQLNRADNAAGVPLPQELQIKNPNQIIIIKKIRFKQVSRYLVTNTNSITLYLLLLLQPPVGLRLSNV